nr:hypothetical protein [Tanacetum cinerariifolium]
PPSVISRAPAVLAQIPVDTTGTPSSTSIDQDALPTSTLPSTKVTQAPTTYQGVKGQETENAQLDNDPFQNIFTPEPSSEESSLRDVITINLHLPNQPFKHLSKWTKNHPLDNDDTPMVKRTKLDKDLEGIPVDLACYRDKADRKALTCGKTGLLMPERTINMGLWYSKDTGIALTTYADANHVGYQDIRRSSSGSAHFLGDRLVIWSLNK